MMKKSISLAVFVFCLFANIHAQQSKSSNFRIEVSQDTVLLGNYFSVVFSIENTNIKNFVAPDFKDFTVLSGPNISTSMSFVNNEMMQSTSYTYYLEPQKIGKFTIKEAIVDTGKGNLESEPIVINVIENPDGIIQNETTTQQPLLRSKQAPAKPKRKTYKI